jgi:hypothetical protein
MAAWVSYLEMTTGATKSPIARFYGNLGWKGSDSEVRLVASEAKNFFGVIHP